MKKLLDYLIGIAIGVIVLILLVGCQKVGTSEPVQDSGNPEVRRFAVTPSTGVYEFRLSDGTRCAAMIDASITCDWRCERGPE